MLGKLIKYDMKSVSRFLIIIHGFLLLSALLGRALLTSHIKFTKNTIDLDSTLLGLAIVLYCLIITVVGLGTYVIIAIRFYKNLFSDEGYLTRTLPVTAGTHLLAKIIVGSIWALIDTVVISLSVWIAIATPTVLESYRQNSGEILESLGFTHNFTPQLLAILFLVFYFFGCLCNIVLLYLSVTLGQLFSSHRILGAVVAYFALNTVYSVITLALFAITGLFQTYIQIDTYSSAHMDFNFAGYMSDLCKVSGITSLAAAVITYAATYYIMKRKIDLG